MALLAHTTIELWSAWHNFARSLYLATAFGARDGRGQRVSLGVPSPLTEQGALGIAVRTLRPRNFAAKNGVGPWDWRDEPNWKNPQHLLSALAALQSSNQTTVQIALSSGTRTWNDLPEFRNFFAHRDLETLRKAQRLNVYYGHPPHERPSVVVSVPSRTTQGTGWQPLLLDWADELIDAAAASTL